MATLIDMQDYIASTKDAVNMSYDDLLAELFELEIEFQRIKEGIYS